MNPYVILTLLVLWGMSLFGVGKWQYGVGQEHERVGWQKKANEELTKANAAIKRLTDEARRIERESALAVNSIAANFAKEKNEIVARGKRDVDAARSGAISLRVPSNCPGPGGSPASETGPRPTGDHATETAELPREVTADLLALANDADEVVRQLTACQRLVESDRVVALTGNEIR